MIKLSPSTIGDFNKCQACFWLDKKLGVKKPRGIFPSLPGGMDRILKPWYDKHRATGELPPELKDKVPGVLYPDQAKVDVWRDALHRGLKCGIGDAVLRGGVDDALWDGSAVSILDAKTRGSAPKQGDSEKYYAAQMDAYGLLFKENGHSVTGKGFLAYYWPVAALPYIGPGVPAGDKLIAFVFNTAVVSLEVNPERTLELIGRIVEVLKRDTAPAPAPDCEYCNFYVVRSSMRLV